MEFDRKGFNHEVGLQLQSVRKRRARTQADVAEAIGISRAAYSSIESGRQTIALDLAWRLAIVLGISLDRLCPEPVRANVAPDGVPPFTNSATPDLLSSLETVDLSIS